MLVALSCRLIIFTVSFSATAERELRESVTPDRRVSKERDIPMSGAIWLAIVAGIVTVVAIVRVAWTKTNARRLDVGAVSGQWVAEHRVGSDNSVSR